MKNFLNNYLPPYIKPFLRKVYYLGADVIDTLKGKDDLTPPRSMIFVGDGDFRKVGEEFKKYFIDLAEIRPDVRALDVGCGIGRMAVPLTSYLSSAGEYWGFDIVKEGIEWCRDKITSRFSNFHFDRVDIYNKNYNPRGKLSAGRYTFFYPNEYFDFVFSM